MAFNSFWIFSGVDGVLRWTRSGSSCNVIPFILLGLYIWAYVGVDAFRFGLGGLRGGKRRWGVQRQQAL